MGNALNFVANNSFTVLNAYMCMHCSLTVLAFIVLYGGHCSSVRFPLKVMPRFPASCNNNTPQQMTIILDIIVTA